MRDVWDTAKAEWLIWVATREGVLTDQQLRRFACWCVRQVWHLLTDERSKHAVEVAERYAGGSATESELAAAWSAAGSAAWSAAGSAAWSAADPAQLTSEMNAAMNAAMNTARAAARAAAWEAAAAGEAAREATWAATWAAQSQYLRSLGNPFEELCPRPWEGAT